MSDTAKPGGLHDVLVLGAGAAGLTAALQLALAGQRVALLEARDRVGGRIFTRRAVAPGRATSLPVELGAEFIHGLPAESWRLVRDAGLDTYELDGSQLRFADGRLQDVPESSGSRAVLQEMAGWAAAQPPGTDQTFEHYLDHSPAAGTPALRNEAIRYVEGFNAADHRVIGVAALARQQAAEDAIEAERIFHVSAGYDAVPQHLRARFEAAGGRLFLERPVASIAWRAGEVVMSGTDPAGAAFEFRAPRAIVTLPVGVLQAGSVRFEPVPQAAFDAIHRMAMGSVIRIPLLFRSRFWASESVTGRMPALAAQLRNLSFLFTDHALPSTWWTCHPDEAPMLVAWAAGPATASLDRSRLMDECLATLSSLFGCSPRFLAEQLVSWHFHDWDADPHSRGAYSYMPAGALEASQHLSRPVADTLFFAGEHTVTSGHWGTVHGALQSGDAAAAALLATLDVPGLR